MILFRADDENQAEIARLESRIAWLEKHLHFFETHCACSLVLPGCQCPHCLPHNIKLSPPLPGTK